MTATSLPSANWSYPTAIRFGAGRISELVESCKALGISKPLLVTDKGLANLPITQSTLDLLEAGGLGRAMFSDVDPNPDERNMEAGVNAYRQGGHDGVIAFGGGSGLDLGKLIAFMAGQTRPVWDFEDVGDWWTRANADAIAPIIAVPTTAGTGSEVGRSSVIINSETQVKKIIFHPQILPSIVISDPELTVGMPPVITVGTGLDAFVHCFEAYCSPLFHPMSAGIALEGMRLVKTYLPRAVADGTDLEARSQMMAAAAMGAVAFQKGLGGCHAVSHSIGAIYHTHHGMTNAVVLPAVIDMNRPAIEEKVEAIARYLNISGGFDGFYKFIMDLRRELGVPDKLGGLGVVDDRIDDMVVMALADLCAASNPVAMTQDNTRRLFEACF